MTKPSLSQCIAARGPAPHWGRHASAKAIQPLGVETFGSNPDVSGGVTPSHPVSFKGTFKKCFQTFQECAHLGYYIIYIVLHEPWTSNITYTYAHTSTEITYLSNKCITAHYSCTSRTFFSRICEILYMIKYLQIFDPAPRLLKIPK